MGRHSKQNHITLLVDLHLVQGVQIFYTITNSDEETDYSQTEVHLTFATCQYF